MPSPFESYDRDKLLALIRTVESSAEAKEAKSALAFHAGDHWQNREAWIGPRPAIDHPSPASFYETIRKDLVSKNIVREIARRDRNGVIGREPNWTVTVDRPLAKNEKPTGDEAKKITLAESALLNWWDTRRYGKKVTLATLQAATDAMNVAKRGLLRFFIPPASIDEEGGIVASKGVSKNVERALSLLYLMSPKYDTAMVVTDEDSQEQAGLFAVNVEGKTRLELVYVNDENQTVIRTIEEKSESESRGYRLGGRLTLYEMQREPLVTLQVQQMQRLFNMSATMRTRTVGLAGFPERTFLNAREPSHMEDDPDRPGHQIEVKDPYKTGLGSTNFVKGEPVVDQNGDAKGFAPVSLVYRDPAKVDTFDQTEDAAYRNILSEVSQTYVLMTGDATSSGESRIQARADFVMALRETKTQVDAAGRWLLETALSWAADLSGQPGLFDGLRVNFDCRLDPGPLSARERELVAAEVTNRLRSREDAMTLLGIDDPTAMLDKIKEENAAVVVNPPAVPELIPEATPGQESEMVS